MSTFELSISDPHAGWLPVCIVLGGEEIKLDASNVLNDPLNELASATRGVLRGDHERMVRFWLEPDTYILHMQPDDTQGRLKIRLLHTPNTEMQTLAGDMVASATVSVESACSAMLRALERCGDQSFKEILGDEWRREFPKEIRSRS